MPGFGNLLILTIIAFLAPLLLGLAPRLRIPSVVLEIVAGVIVGPSVLGLVRMDQAVQIVALLGLAFLLFLAGLEVDLHRLRGPLLRVALIGYVVSLAVGVAAGFSFGAAGWVRDPMLIAVALSATSLGLVVPVLKDAGRADQTMGQTTITATDARSARWGLVLAGFFAGAFFFITATIGLLATVLFPGVAPDQALTTVVMRLIPAGIVGLVVAALLSVVMSTASSSLNSIAVVFVKDIYRPLVDPDASARKQLWLERALSLGVGVWMRCYLQDWRPIIGPVPGADGVFTTSGHCTLGLALAPATADALVPAVLHGTIQTGLAPFSVPRFARCRR
ncbi:cation:proton antiporter [Saccharopolyspora sp. NPDC050389]|uniref:sodium:solute symporter family transporter n=1 Tax=Saccharopolyspora sp. NPDC050389 TaxID=3155516 RepID=UPI0033F80968